MRAEGPIHCEGLWDGLSALKRNGGFFAVGPFHSRADGPRWYGDAPLARTNPTRPPGFALNCPIDPHPKPFDRKGVASQTPGDFQCSGGPKARWHNTPARLKTPGSLGNC